MPGYDSNNKTIYILGAGSSISHTYPVLKGNYPGIYGIFQKAWQLGKTAENGVLRPEFYELNRYLTDKFGIGLDAQIDFEKAFTFIEIEFQKDGDNFGRLYQQLLQIVDHVFMKLLNEIEDKQLNEYINLIELLNSLDTIITFNWDVLLDNELGRICWIESLSEGPTQCPKSEKKVPGNKNYYYENFIKGLLYGGHQYSYPKISKHFGFFLKLHGSVDWHYCQNNVCIHYNKIRPTTFPLQDSKCLECMEPNRTLIIPPTLKKSVYPMPLISKLWNMAIEEIRDANRIVIWGYSFPPTDFYAEWLIRHVDYAKLQEVIVINKEQMHIDRIKDYFRLPESHKIPYNSFAEYYEYLKDKM